MHKATEPVSILFVYCKTHKEKIKQNNHKKQQEEEEEGTTETHNLLKYRINNLQKSKLSILPSKFRRTLRKLFRLLLLLFWLLVKIRIN